MRSCGVDQADRFSIEPGTMDDYHTLRRFHYHERTPATVVVVYRMVFAQLGIYQRLTRGPEAMNGDGELVGVVVVSMPHLGCALRNRMLPGRYTGMPRSDAGRGVNREIRSISRVIIDPRFRGLGLAVRLVRHVIARADTPLVEALATMGRINPFFERAGMQRCDPQPTPAESRFVAVLAELDLTPLDLADSNRAEDCLDHLDAESRGHLLNELRRFAIRCRQRHDPPGGATNLSLSDQLKRARRCLCGAPIYYLARTRVPLPEELSPHPETPQHP